jgi:hypothetical protein
MANKKIEEEFIKNLRKKDKEHVEYFKSEEFNSLIKVISQYEFIDQTRLQYKLDSVEGITAEQFGKVCNTVFYNLQTNEWDIKFPTYYVDYEGIRFHLIIGQGSTHITTADNGEKNCLKHPNNIDGFNGTLDELAQKIENMQYDKTAEFIDSLADYTKIRADTDKTKGREKLSSHLYEAVEELYKARDAFQRAWKTCEPYMKKQ